MYQPTERCCPSPLASVDGTACLSYARPVRRYRSGSSLGQFRAERPPPPPNRSLPDLPASVSRGTSGSHALSPTAEQFDDTAAPPYTPSSCETFSGPKPVVSSPISPSSTSKFHAYGNDASPTLRRLNPLEIPFTIPEARYSADVPVSPMTDSECTSASSYNGSFRGPGLSYVPHTGSTIILNNCNVTFAGGGFTSEEMVWKSLNGHSSATIMTNSDTQLYQYGNCHQTCRPSISDRLRSCADKVDIIRKRRLCRFLMPQVLPNSWKRRDTKSLRDCRKVSQYATTTCSGGTEFHSFFDDRQSILQRAQNLVEKAIQSCY